ncbi:hypothetical protein Tco_1053491 [Tanacetum coccineum]|uniref:Uncharacterized protein n=1 Tax=Tanacetum coccineum TaxID=301880 RepID=A0ABQ5GUI7_9ASTR
MFVGFQANMSKLAFSTSHIAFLPSLARSPPIITDYSGDLALSVLIVATLALVGNFIMPWPVDGTAPRARIPGLPRILLYCEGDLTTKKLIHTVAWYGCFPKDTHRGRKFIPKDWTIKMASPLYFWAASAFFTILLVLAL